MTLQLGNIYHGFKLTEEKQVKEINSLAQIFNHEKSGARLMFLKNEDDNKVFSITFRTPPEDSTGVAHIVEHSVLCGSRKFNMKEPFVELVKGSLNTYLNAMTFPDKTMYPVASRNDKDFQNLMDVYLDAVFFPNIYNQPEILMQEGWHYELEDKDAELTYKGVVYNEMKGAFSSPEAILDKEILASLFPDTTYGYESGGDPDVIPDLTQEGFLEFHRKFYHPANSYMYLYGDIDILEKLDFINREYLGKFEKIETHSEVQEQKLFSAKVEKAADYPVSPNEQVKDKTFISLNYIVGKATEPEKTLAFQILEHLLLRTPAAPLKKALLDAEIGKDVMSIYSDSILQPTFSIIVSGSNEDQKEKFEQVVNQTLAKLVKDGLDKQLIEASINLLEFKLREADFGRSPKGLVYNIKCMNSWLYDESPFLHLEYEAALAKVKTALTGNYFEQLIKDRLIENGHKTLVVLRPNQGLAEAKAKEITEHLASYKAKLSPAEIETIIEQTKKLRVMQETPDTAETLAVIPLLSLSDIEPESEKLILVEKNEQQTKVLFHPVGTNQIAYVNLYYDASGISQSKLPYAYLLAEFLGKVSTEKYEYTELANEININTGGIIYDLLAYTENDSDDIYYPKFRIKSKALVSKLPKMFDLVGQITARSVFADKKRAKELVQQVKSSLTMFLMRNSQQVAAGRVLSYFSQSSKFNEMGLLTFYEFMVDLEKNFDAKFEEINASLSEAAKIIFNRDNLIVSVTVEDENYEKFQQAFKTFYSYLGNTEIEKQKYNFELEALNEGLMTSGKVQYVAKGANFRKLGFDYHGSLKVLETILRYDYLWNKIRVQGGAYGAFAQFRRNGNMVLGSYRDPNLRETINVYDQTPEYLRSFNVSEREMTKYIIGTMSQLDTPLTPQMKGDVAAECYLRKITQDIIQQERNEVLSTRQEDIKKLADLIDAAMKENYLCVLGSEQKICDNKDAFKHTKNIFE
ncbi:insulinase family protein [Dendrosporobacter sp. 1207_IL3150]|uniref:insulinase family protein n=1 Tax=Dendrosporobacter sp. 1207_IL3150 TaxID=3084054 RepID=UPI002FD95057